MIECKTVTTLLPRYLLRTPTFIVIITVSDQYVSMLYKIRFIKKKSQMPQGIHAKQGQHYP